MTFTVSQFGDNVVQKKQFSGQRGCTYRNKDNYNFYKICLLEWEVQFSCCNFLWFLYKVVFKYQKRFSILFHTKSGEEQTHGFLCLLLKIHIIHSTWVVVTQIISCSELVRKTDQFNWLWNTGGLWRSRSKQTENRWYWRGIKSNWNDSLVHSSSLMAKQINAC